MLVFIIFCCIGIAFYGLHKMSHKLKDLENSSKSPAQTKEKENAQKQPYVNFNVEKPKTQFKNPEVIPPPKKEENQVQSKDYVEQGLNWILNKVNKK